MMSGWVLCARCFNIWLLAMLNKCFTKNIIPKEWRQSKISSNMGRGSNDSRLHVVEPPRGRYFIWQIGVKSFIQDRRQVDRGFYGVESVVRGNADSLLN